MVAVGADVWILTETWSAIELPGFRSLRSPSSLGLYDASESAAAIHVREDWSLTEIQSSGLYVCAEARRPDGGAPLLVVGTIIPWHAAPGGKKWEVHVREAAVQAACWVRLRAAYPKHRLVVAGDFNTTLCAAGTGYGTANGRSRIHGGMQSAGLVCPTAESWVADDQPATGTRHLIDHILIDGRWLAGGPIKLDKLLGPTGRMLSDHPLVSLDVIESDGA